MISETILDDYCKYPNFEFDGNIKIWFIKTDLKLKDYLKTMYNNYYIKLGNE